MAQLLVRNVPDAVVRALKLRAAEHGVSAEEEHRRILAEKLDGDKNAAGYDFKDHLAALGDVDGDIFFERPRSKVRRPVPDL